MDNLRWTATRGLVRLHERVQYCGGEEIVPTSQRTAVSALKLTWATRVHSLPMLEHRQQDPTAATDYRSIY